VRLRDKAKDDGLDPNKWFGNVELEVARAGNCDLRQQYL
jgi:hypothetical protein